jgi:hypothetical protein
MACTELASELGLSINTIDKAFQEKGVRAYIAKQIADFFEKDVLELLSPRDVRFEPPKHREAAWEWERAELLQPGVRASNGLHFFVYKMKHKSTPNRFGRGKYYHLSGLADAERVRQQQYLQRHPDVTNRIGVHPNLAMTLSSTSVGDLGDLGDAGWWVVDHWLDAKPLADILNTAWPLGKALPVLADMATGLKALHAAGTRNHT